jgi:hypothetical protein
LPLAKKQEHLVIFQRQIRQKSQRNDLKDIGYEKKCNQLGECALEYALSKETVDLEAVDAAYSCFIYAHDKIYHTYIRQACLMPLFDK